MKTVSKEVEGAIEFLVYSTLSPAEKMTHSEANDLVSQCDATCIGTSLKGYK
jgi:hypothetical protein